MNHELSVDVWVERSKHSHIIYALDKKTGSPRCTSIQAYLSEYNYGRISHTTNYRGDHSELSAIILTGDLFDEPMLPLSVVPCKLLGMFDIQTMDVDMNTMHRSTMIVCPSREIDPRTPYYNNINVIDEQTQRNIRYSELANMSSNDVVLYADFIGQQEATDEYIKSLNWETD